MTPREGLATGLPVAGHLVRQLCTTHTFVAAAARLFQQVGARHTVLLELDIQVRHPFELKRRLRSARGSRTKSGTKVGNFPYENFLGCFSSGFCAWRCFCLFRRSSPLCFVRTRSLLQRLAQNLTKATLGSRARKKNKTNEAHHLY